MEYFSPNGVTVTYHPKPRNC